VNGLLAIVDEAAVAAGAARGVRGESVEYEVGGVLVAVVGPADAEFGLGPEVAAAALGTPDTHASPRGPGWVALRPRKFDRFALDRAAAWFGLAVRVSLRPPGPPASPAR
jgi:hypothetical protein